MAKSKEIAKDMLRNYGVPLGQDFHRLNSTAVESILEAAETYGYRKRKNAPGSTARMFYEYANK